ncbi:hypothetical protein ACOSQ3_010311 [Xanthoceras sorbifolium]
MLGIDSRVEKLETEVISLTVGQQQILENLNELSMYGLLYQSSHYAPKFVKLDFPRFNGEKDTTSWFCRVNQCFEFNHTPKKDRVLTWQEFHDGSDLRFGVTKFQDLFAKVGYLPPNRQVSCFIGSLEDSIKTDVLVGCPTTISSAIRLARLYEAHNTSQH